MRWIGGLGVLLAAGSAGASPGTDCRRAATEVERTICASSDLRTADARMAELYGVVFKAALPGPRQALLAGQRAWLAQRDRDCTSAACLGPRIADRTSVLAALAALVSDPNPTLFSMTAIWLTGSWRVEPQVPERPSAYGPFLEAPGIVRARAGELCRQSGSCFDFGLQAVTNAQSDRERKALGELGLGPSPTMYLAIVNGKADYELVLSSDGVLTAIAPDCNQAGDECHYVHQRWVPDGVDARVVTRSAGP